MPVIFIHGVNTRNSDANYQKNVEARNVLLQRLVLDSLASKEDRFKKMETINPYWGKDGVSFGWNLETLPQVRFLEHLGGDDEATPEADFEITMLVRELSGARRSSSFQLESMGAEEGWLKLAAEKDLRRFVEAVLSPIILSEMQLGEETPEREGTLQALLVIAADEVARHPDVNAEVAAADSDEEVMELLKERVQARFEELLDQEHVTSTESPSPARALEPLGPAWLEGLKERVGELFDRAKDAPARAPSVISLQQFRERVHDNLSRFLGDVFVYLNERGEKTKPGPIVATVLDAIETAPKHHSDEPLIIITHSMGGNILYDILTHYAPGLRVDFWASIAGQVGQFEEMKLFKASDKAIRAPHKVVGEPRVGYWLNIYDPADSLAFKVAPVFAEVDADLEYLTGASALKSHGEYFNRASFYHMLRGHLEKALL